LSNHQVADRNAGITGNKRTLCLEKIAHSLPKTLLIVLDECFVIRKPLRNQ